MLTTTPTGTYQYAWTGADGTALNGNVNQQTGLVEGGYKVAVTDTLHECKVDSAFILKSPANQLRLVPVIKDALCSIPNSGTITLTVSGGTAATYVWRDRNSNVVSTTAVFGQASPGVYTVQVVDINGCKALSDSIKVGLDSTGFARLGPDTLKCNGLAVSLQPVLGDIPGNVYQWSTGASTPTITVTQPGTYSLVLRNTLSGCVGRTSVRVDNRPATPPFLIPSRRLFAKAIRGQRYYRQMALPV